MFTIAWTFLIEGLVLGRTTYLISLTTHFFYCQKIKTN